MSFFFNSPHSIDFYTISFSYQNDDSHYLCNLPRINFIMVGDLNDSNSSAILCSLNEVTDLLLVYAATMSIEVQSRFFSRKALAKHINVRLCFIYH